MFFKYWFFGLLASLAITFLEGNENCCEHAYDSRFYLKLDSGVSFSQKLDIDAPLAFWDTAKEGYNDNVGNRPIIGLGVGYEFPKVFSTDVTFAFRPQYKYRKFQTPLPGPTTPSFLGTKTRAFDLDIATLMLSGYLSGRGCSLLTWEISAFPGAIYPIVGVGIGMSRVLISNFHASGLPPVFPAIDPTPSFGSSSDCTIRYTFTYQLMGGLEYRYCDAWGISMGYRWFEVAKFKGPRFLRDPSGTALDISPNEMRIKFAAQELFAEFKLFF